MNKLKLYSTSYIGDSKRFFINAFYIIVIGINFVIYAILIWIGFTDPEAYLKARIFIAASNCIAVIMLWITGLRLIRESDIRISSGYTTKIKWVIGICSEALITRMIYDIVAIWEWNNTKEVE